MKNLLLMMLLALACSFACGVKDNPSQSKQLYFPESPPDPLEEKYFIKHYKGYLGQEEAIPITMLFVNWGDGRLTGNVHYQNHLGILSFEGQLKKDGTFTLAEERFQKHNSTFNGQLHGVDKISGTWWNQDSTQSLPFRLTELLPKYDHAKWTGAWHLNDPWDTSTLIIGGVSDQKFEFAMNIYINGYREHFFGTADIIEDTIAKVDYLDDEINTENCHLLFHRRNNEVYLDQKSFPFLCDLGHNCWIRGHYEDIYTGRIPKMTDHIGSKSIFPDTNFLTKWLSTVGPQNEKRFAYAMERIQYTKGYRDFHGLNGSIWEGRVRGFHREKEAIITYDPQGNIWAAVTTAPIETMGPMSVHYFTNNAKWSKRLPVFIKNWMKEFRNCEVVYESAKTPQ